MDLVDPAFHHHARVHTEAMGGQVAALLEEAVAAGELTDGVDVDQLARAVRVTYNGSLILWALTGDGVLTDALRVDLDSLLTPYRKGTR